MYKHSTVYDTWRHVFFVYPFWAVAAAIGWDTLSTFIKDEKKKWIPVAIAFAGLLPTVIWTIHSHPNQYTYFNQFSMFDRMALKNSDQEKYADLEVMGGMKGAYGFYDIDYYQNSGRQAAEWILKNVKPILGRKILVRSNMGGFDKYFANDTSWIMNDYGRYGERHWKDWDYYVAYPRYISTELMQHNKWNLQNTIHAVTLDGVPLCVVLKRTSYAGTAANDAYIKKDYATAAQKYAEYIAQDTTDEFAYLTYGVALANIGQVDAAITQVNKAIKLDPSRPDFYDILSQLYMSTGNQQAAQQAKTIGLELTQQQQPPEAEPESE
jgi:tetratricopeptide (TPR) repeat protein